jgi:putative addiction module component (TIGR02574 family)
MLTREEILNHALALPPADRQLVAVALQDSLDTGRASAESLTGNEFYQELQRRAAAYRAGQTQARPASEVMAEMNQRQRDEAHAIRFKSSNWIWCNRR